MRFQILCSTESVSSYIEYITLLAITSVCREVLWQFLWQKFLICLKTLWPEAESNCRPLVFQIWANHLTWAKYNLFTSKYYKIRKNHYRILCIRKKVILKKLWPEAESNCRSLVFQTEANHLSFHHFNLFVVNYRSFVRGSKTQWAVNNRDFFCEYVTVLWQFLFFFN